MNHKSLFFVLFTFFSVFSLAQNDAFERIEGKELEKINERTLSELYGDKLIEERLEVVIDSAFIDKKAKTVNLYYTKDLAFQSIREDWVERFNTVSKGAQKWRIRRKYQVNNYIDSLLLREYIPNIYRSYTSVDSSRYEVRDLGKEKHVKNVSNTYKVDNGLNNRHIALWGGHGRYYNNYGYWEWQRANLFTVVEDMFTFSFVVPYLIPMLENAGANVYYPKERDVNSEEFVIDRDTNSKQVNISKGVREISGGFRYKKFYKDDENPFKLGNSDVMETIASSNRSDSIVYKVDEIPLKKYSLYISYASGENISDAKYSVYHDGGKTDFVVNQKMGQGTWVYLGEFKFSLKNSRIVVTNNSKEKGIVSSDAIKIGGGVNHILRNSSTSPYPAYMNGARYNLQYTGMPDSVYNLHHGVDDYADDYRSRGEWVNYLAGDKYCFNRDSTLKGLNIPIDLSLAIHTDAGTTKNDSTIGTLLIHSTTGYHLEKKFPDGRSRYTNRDLADIIQNEIVGKIHSSYKEEWRKRSIWDKRYSEATYPNVPSSLIELMSHQNFADMKYGLNPNFKFDISRSVYKAIVKYLAEVNNVDYKFTPLAVNSFGLSIEDKNIVLNWEESIESGEENTSAEGYIVYTKINDLDFDNGVVVEDNKFVFENVELGNIYTFKVKALNSGGVSFDSELLSAAIFSFSDNPILIVNGFEKTSGPEFIESDSLGGFPNWKKGAIASGYDYSFTGVQYNFDKNDPWITNPLTGHGASYSDYEGKLVIGNSFDYPFQHGKFYKERKRSFISTSLKGFESRTHIYKAYNKMDLIFGKQSKYSLKVKEKNYDYSIFRKSSRDAIDAWKADGKSILLSGAFIASDVFSDNIEDTLRTKWVEENLSYRFVTNNASNNGAVKGSLEFNLIKKPNDKIYELRSVDAIKSVKSKSKIMLRYKENNYPAAVFSNRTGLKVYSFGFPLLSVEESKQKLLFDEVIEKLNW